MGTARGYLETFAYFACVGYATVPFFWFLTHPLVARWRRMKRSPYWIILPYWFLVWLLLATLAAPWRHAEIYDLPWLWIPGVALVVTGFSFYWRAKRGFTRKQLSGEAELRPGDHPQRLVTGGVRDVVRHPIYLGHFCEMLGFSLGAGTIATCGLTALTAITGAIMLRLEEKELVERFGDAYREYQRRVPMVLPLPRRS